MKTLGIRNYSNIAKRAAERAKDKRPQFAIVTGIDGVRIDLKVGESQTVIKNVEVIGDTAQLLIGDTVQISWWSQDRPVAIAGSNLIDTTDRITVLENRVNAIPTSRPTSTPNPVGGIGDWQILRFSGGALASVHEPNVDGMQDAIDVSSSGDMILLPAIELTMDFTVPAGVTITGLSRFSSKIYGTVTLSSGSSLDKLNVVDTNTDSTTSTAVIASATSRIHDSDIWGCNCGGGAAYGIELAGGTLTVTSSTISGEGTPGYGVYTTDGTTRIYETTIYGTTSQYGDENSVYVHGTLEGVSVCVCPAFAFSSLYSLNGESLLSFYKQRREHEMSATSLSEIFRFVKDDYIYGVAMTEGNLYSTNKVIGQPALIIKHSLTGLGSSLVSTIGDTVYGIASIVLDDTMAYTLYHNYDEVDETLRIGKCDLIEETSSVLEEYPATGVTFSAVDYDLDKVIFAYRVQGDIDRIFFLTSWTSNSPDNVVIRITIFDIPTETVVYDEFQDVLDNGGNHADSFYANPPVQYGNKVVFVAQVDQVESYAGALCPFPVFVIDCDTLTVDMVDNYTVNPLSGYWGNALYGGAINRDTGVFYFSVEDYSSGASAALFSTTISTLTTAFVSTNGDNEFAMLQIGDMPYAFEYSTNIVKTIPDLSTVVTFDAGGSFTVDDVNEIVFMLREDELEGYSIPGGEEVHIPLTWDGDIWDYSESQSISNLVVGMNKALVFVDSRTAVYPYTYQLDYVLFG